MRKPYAKRQYIRFEEHGIWFDFSRRRRSHIIMPSGRWTGRLLRHIALALRSVDASTAQE